MIYFLIVLVLGLSTGVGLYYKNQGYTFIKVFIGALLGFTGLAALFWKMYNGQL